MGTLRHTELLNFMVPWLLSPGRGKASQARAQNCSPTSLPLPAVKAARHTSLNTHDSYSTPRRWTPIRQRFMLTHTPTHATCGLTPLLRWDSTPPTPRRQVPLGSTLPRTDPRIPEPPTPRRQGPRPQRPSRRPDTHLLGSPPPSDAPSSPHGRRCLAEAGPAPGSGLASGGSVCIEGVAVGGLWRGGRGLSLGCAGGIWASRLG